MVAYRGVSQQDVINSIICACELEQKHSPGAACDKEIDTLLADVPMLQKATDDAKFISALRDSNVSILLRMRELFEAYAINNTDGVGRKVFENLNTWGAFVGSITMEWRQMDGEINIYSFITELRRITAVDEQRVREIIRESRYKTDEKEIRDGIADLRSVVSLAQSGASDQMLTEAYERMGIGSAEGRIVREAVQQLSKDTTIYATSANLFDKFGVVIKGMNRDNVQQKMQENKQLIEDVQKVVNIFAVTDEVMNGFGVMIGIIRDQDINLANKNGPLGIVFVSTNRVAQAVADAFPNETVLRSDGSTVLPSVAKSLLKKTKGPTIK